MSRGLTEFFECIHVHQRLAGKLRTQCVLLDDFEIVGTFNPGAVRVGEEIVLLVRVAERPRERRLGFTGLPRWDTTAGLVVDRQPVARENFRQSDTYQR